MQAPKFQHNKIARLIKTQGVFYTFRRKSLDEFKEPVEAVSTVTIRGVFHQTTQHISVVGADAASVQSKQTPYILTLYEEGKRLKPGDYITINGIQYKITGLLDIGNWNIALDVSLEASV